MSHMKGPRTRTSASIQIKGLPLLFQGQYVVEVTVREDNTAAEKVVRFMTCRTFDNLKICNYDSHLT